MDNSDHQPRTRIGRLLESNLLFKVGELLLVFLAALTLIKVFEPFAGENLILRQAIVWVANILMLILVWLGVYLREQSWRDFGLTFGPVTFREGLQVFLLSILVFVLAVMGFMLGSIIMANITGIPQSTDLTSYDYLKDNLFMLLLTLIGVYIVSSFGEEVIYRAFLINRITEMGLDSRVGRAIAVVVSAIIFGLVHFDWGPMGMVQTGFMGLVLGICYLKLKKRLWILILAHGYMDTLLMVQLYLASN